MNQKETRTCTGSLRAKTRGKGSTLTGYASVFSTPYDLGTFDEQVAPGAFDGVLQDDVRALFNHDASNVLGRTTAGTLRLSVDSWGLRFEVDLPESAEVLREAVARKDIDQASFGFLVGEDVWEKRDGRDLRTITSVSKLFDVGPVTFGASPSTEVALRSLERCRGKVCKPLSRAEAKRQLEARSDTSFTMSRAKARLRELERELTPDRPMENWFNARRVAIHEAGHAVALLAVGAGVEEVVLRDGGGGHTMWIDSTAVTAMTMLAGVAAAKNAAPNGVLAAQSKPSPSDLRHAREAVHNAPRRVPSPNQPGPTPYTLTEGDVDRAMRRARQDAQLFVRRSGPKISAVAEALLKHRRLTGEQVEKIIQNAA